MSQFPPAAPGMKFCHACGQSIDARAEICPHCGVRQTSATTYGSEPPELREASSKKIAAGICGILLGYLGVHKFILGMNTAGLIMLLVTLLTCFIASPVMMIVGIIEGVIYLTKSDAEFHQLYVVQKKDWF